MGKKKSSEFKQNAYRHGKHLLLLCIIGLALVFTGSLAHAQEGQADEKKHVLILNSYHQGLSWTDSIMQGIQSVFAGSGVGTELHVEYMDTKRLVDQAYLEDIFNLFSTKYTTVPVDIIITSDNDAFNFMRQHRDDLFPGIPVVFSGVNNFSDDQLAGIDNFTGVVEATDLKSTLEVMLAQNPNTNRIYVINDQTPTGEAMIGELMEVQALFEDRVEFVINDDFKLSELQVEVANLPADTLILMLVANQDNTGQFFTYEESLEAITAVSPVPVYSVWDFYLGYGIVGGMLTNGVSQGQMAAEMALSLLQGEDIANVPIVRESPNSYMFDYAQLTRFGLETSTLPPGSTLINEPVSFYSQYRAYIWGAVALFLFLVFVVIILLINISQRQRAQKELQLSVERRGRQVDLSTQVSQAISQATDLNDLYQRVVTEVKEQFGYYHTQLLRYDPDLDAVRLIAGYGDIGREMIAQSHKMPMGVGLIGTAAATGDAVLRANLTDDPDWQPNPLLPDTRGEIAVPIKLGDEVLGVLDVQSSTANALTTDDQLLLEGLCGQIAVAIDSTRLTSELQESSSFLNSIIDNIPNMVFVKEAQELRFVRMNKAGQAYFGASLENIVGKNDYDFFPKEEADFFTGKDQEVLASGKPVSIPEETIESAFGPRILHTTKVPVLGADGEARYLLGISMDITERKQTEALLFDEQNRTRAILEAIGTPVVIANVTDGVLVYVNDPLAQLIGIPRQELIGRQTPDFFQNPADRQVYVDALRQQGQVNNFEVMLKRGDGAPFWALMSGQISQFQGETVTITSLIDITERQEAVALLEANERRYQQILDAITHMVLVKGSESRIVWANKAFREYYGMSNEALQNLIDAPFNEPDYTLQYVKDDAYVYETGTVLDIPEEIVTRYDGHEGLFHTVKSPIFGADNQVILTVGVSEEISERKRVEAAMTKQAVELQTVADLSTAVSKTLDTEQLLQEVVDRTKESFNLYHAHIYLLDETSGVLKLAAGAGEVGAQMAAAGYSIPADHPHSLVAQAAQSKQGVIVNNVAADPAFLPNPLLPNTKSEMAVPMIVGNKVIGVLDIQADTVDYFTHTDVNIQTTLAAQTAVALENARAFEQARQSTIIIDNTTNIIATMSLEQKILSLNNAGLRRLGYESLADVQGQNVSVLFPKDGVEERRTPAMMAVQQHGFWRGESMLITKSGERFPVEQVITMIRDENGMPQMIIFNMTDITEQKEAELAQQALTAELEEQLERVNALQRAMTREGWQAYMTASKRPFQGFEFNQDGVKALIAQDLVGGHNGKSQKAGANGANQVINPVKIHGATIGQIGARNANGEPLSDAQRELLAALTNQVAEALERARLSEQTQIALTETEQREQQLAVLNAMAQSLTAQTTVDGVLAVIHEYTKRLMASDEFYVAFFTAAANEIVFAYAVTEGRIIRNYGRRQAGKGLTEHVLALRQPVLIASDIDKYLHEIGIEAIGRQAASWMGCPLQYGDQVIGLISLQSYHTPYAYNQQDLRLLSAIANQAAIAIENARLIEATDQRARQEQLLREVSAKVGAAVDAESVLQTAAREIGRALGLETFVYLKDPKKNQ